VSLLFALFYILGHYQAMNNETPTLQSAYASVFEPALLKEIEEKSMIAGLANR
jgi:hypothetical protein